MKGQIQSILFIGIFAVVAYFLLSGSYLPKGAVYTDAGYKRYSMSCSGSYECDLSFPNDRCDNLIGGVYNVINLRHSALPTCDDVNNPYAGKLITVTWDNGNIVNTYVGCGGSESTILATPFGWGDVNVRCGNNFNNYASISGHISIKSPVVTTTTAVLIGQPDSHGCYPSGGYSWCESKQKCLRSWEEDCFLLIDPPAINVLASVSNFFESILNWFWSIIPTGELSASSIQTTSIYVNQPITNTISVNLSEVPDTDKSDGSVTLYYITYRLYSPAKSVLMENYIPAQYGSNGFTVSFTPSTAGSYEVIVLTTRHKQTFSYATGQWTTLPAEQVSQSVFHYVTNEIPTPPSIDVLSQLSSMFTSLLAAIWNLFGLH